MTGARGFTLVEMVTVLLLLSILMVGTVRYITHSAEGYAIAVRSSDLAAHGRLAVERLQRELRNALPGSVRTDVNQCIEFLPVIAGTQYLDVPDADGVNTALDFPQIGGGAASNRFSVVTPEVDVSSAANVAVYPVSTAQVYSVSPTASLNGYVSIAANGTSSRISDVTMTDSHRFPHGSPSRRVFFTGSPVTWCVLTSAFGASAGQLRRYAGYGFNVVQAQPALASSTVVSEGIDTSNPVFTYHPGSPERSAIVQVTFQVSRADQTMTLSHEVQIRNAP